MLKLGIALTLVTLVCAQPPRPQPPNIPETFSARVRVFDEDRAHHRHFESEAAHFRNMEKDMARLTVFVRTEDGKHSNYTILERFDMKMAYEFEENATGIYCKHESTGDKKFEPEFAWVKEADGESNHKDPRTGDIVEDWRKHIANLEVELFVDEKNHDVPIAILVHHGRGEMRDERFEEFKPGAPDMEVFEVPKACM